MSLPGDGDGVSKEVVVEKEACREIGEGGGG